MDVEITMVMTVFIAKRKPVNQLPETSEKEYEEVQRGWGRKRLHGNNMQ